MCACLFRGFFNEGYLSTMESSSKKGKGKGRGITYLPRLTKSRSVGIKQVVEYNSKGVPRGKVATTYSSYCGTLARTRVPIIYANWYEVPKELKDKLWSCVEVSMVVVCAFKLVLFNFFHFINFIYTSTS